MRSSSCETTEKFSQDSLAVLHSDDSRERNFLAYLAHGLFRVSPTFLNLKTQDLNFHISPDDCRLRQLCLSKGGEVRNVDLP